MACAVLRRICSRAAGTHAARQFSRSLQPGHVRCEEVLQLVRGRCIFEFAMAAVNSPGGSVSDAGWSIMSFFRDRPPIEERAWRMGTEVVVFLKVFFQDYCRLLGLPR